MKKATSAAPASLDPDPSERFARVLRCPTLESQLIDCLAACRELGPKLSVSNFELGRAPFRLYLRSSHLVPLETPVWEIQLATVELPPRFQGRRWFTVMADLCATIMPHDVLVLQDVANVRFWRHLFLNPKYARLGPDQFARFKRGPASYPIRRAMLLGALAQEGYDNQAQDYLAAALPESLGESSVTPEALDQATAAAFAGLCRTPVHAHPPTSGWSQSSQASFGLAPSRMRTVWAGGVAGCGTLRVTCTYDHPLCTVRVCDVGGADASESFEARDHPLSELSARDQQTMLTLARRLVLRLGRQLELSLPRRASDIQLDPIKIDQRAALAE